MRCRTVILIVLLALGCSRTAGWTPSSDEPPDATESTGGTGTTDPVPAPSAPDAPAAAPQPSSQPEPTAPPPSQPEPTPPTATVATGCDERVTSDLPGASIRVTTRRCSYSLAELVAGVDIAYEVRVEQALKSLKPHTRGDDVLEGWPSWVVTFRLGCIAPKDASNLVVANWVVSPSAGGLVSCPDCDLGRCRSADTPAVDVAPGTYAHTWRKWTGQEFLGESDTGRTPGDPFPPGEYRLVLRADGNFVPSESAAPKLFHMETTRRITITP